MHCMSCAATYHSLQTSLSEHSSTSVLLLTSFRDPQQYACRHVSPSGRAGNSCKLSPPTSSFNKLRGSSGRCCSRMKRQSSSVIALVLRLLGSASRPQYVQSSWFSVGGSAGRARSLLQLLTSSWCNVGGSSGSERSLPQPAKRSCCSCGGRGGSTLMHQLLMPRWVNFLQGRSDADSGGVLKNRERDLQPVASCTTAREVHTDLWMAVSVSFYWCAL